MGEARLLPNAPRCCAVQARCDRAGRWKESGLFLERMAMASIELGVIAYGTAANGCRAQGLWPRALALLRELGILGCEVSDIAINTGLASCSYGYAWGAGAASSGPPGGQGSQAVDHCSEHRGEGLRKPTALGFGSRAPGSSDG